MLTKSDIDLIKRTRAEVTANRTDSVILYQKQVVGEDPFTGDLKYEEVEVESECTFRRYTSKSPGTDDIKIVDGVKVEQGDAFAEFDISVDLSGVETIKHAPTGELWRVKGIDTIGLGEPNRHYVLLGRVH